MVSLSNNSSYSRSFYDVSTNQTTINSAESDEDLIIDHIELVSGPELLHRPIKTTWAIILSTLIFVVLGVSAYIIPLECGTKGTKYKCGDDALSLVLYIHGGIWLTLFLLDRYFHVKHNESRLNGYLDFYRRTMNIRRVPLLINSCANAVILIVVQVMEGHCDVDACFLLTKTHYIQILISIECVPAIIVMIVYLVLTLKFNNQKALPDVSQGELLSGGDYSRSISDLGFRNGTYDDQVLEKQADMIRYLKQHMEMLARRNLSLTEEIYQLKQKRALFR